MSVAKSSVEALRRVFTTNPGLEPIVRAEFKSRARRCGYARGDVHTARTGVRGRVEIAAPAALMEAVAPAMRSVHHILRPVHRFMLADGDDDLAAIGSEVGALDIPELRGAASFRVTSGRRGEHGFSSMDVQRVAGAALQARWGLPVDLTGYAVDVHVDVIGGLCTVAVALTRAPLSNRHPRLQSHPAALRANIAYAALRMAGLGDGEGSLLDPFCGSGTILMEAGALAPRLQLLGGDWDRRTIAGAAVNLNAAGLSGRARLHCRDAMRLAEHYPPGTVDLIVTNPPYGRKLARTVYFPDFYRRLFQAAAAVLPPGGRLVLLADRKGALRRGLRAAGGFRQRRARLVQMSGVWPSIFVFERE